MVSYMRKTTHLYNICVATYKAISLNGSFSEKNISNLIEFYRQYELVKEEDGARVDQKVIEYKALMLDGTRSKQSRLKRSEILNEVIGL